MRLYRYNGVPFTRVYVAAKDLASAQAKPHRLSIWRELAQRKTAHADLADLRQTHDELFAQWCDPTAWTESADGTFLDEHF